jgi:hypothetical protein
VVKRGEGKTGGEVRKDLKCSIFVRALRSCLKYLQEDEYYRDWSHQESANLQMIRCFQHLQPIPLSEHTRYHLNGSSCSGPKAKLLGSFYEILLLFILYCLIEILSFIHSSIPGEEEIQTVSLQNLGRVRQHYISAMERWGVKEPEVWRD